MHYTKMQENHLKRTKRRSDTANSTLEVDRVSNRLSDIGRLKNLFSEFRNDVEQGGKLGGLVDHCDTHKTGTLTYQYQSLFETLLTVQCLT